MANNQIRVYYRRKIVMSRFNPGQAKMLQIGQIALKTVKDRIAEAKNENDANSLPLKKGYAIFKASKRGGRGVRDLRLTGEMLDNFTLRTVSETTARARNTTTDLRKRAVFNQGIERWVVYSPRNKKDLIAGARPYILQAFKESIKSVPVSAP